MQLFKSTLPDIFETFVEVFWGVPTSWISNFVILYPQFYSRMVLVLYFLILKFVSQMVVETNIKHWAGWGKNVPDMHNNCLIQMIYACFLDRVFSVYLNTGWKKDLIRFTGCLSWSRSSLFARAIRDCLLARAVTQTDKMQKLIII